MSIALVINSGSSSFKYQLIEMDSETTLASGLVERIGDDGANVTHRVPATDVKERLEHPIADHRAGFAAMYEAFGRLGPSLDEFPPVVVGHRVVHGGQIFSAATVVDEQVKRDVRRLGELAPLHNPANLEGIEAAELAFPDVPHVVVVDTAFHQTIAPEAYTYAIDASIAQRHMIRRYGAHGTSHKFVSQTAAEFLGRPLARLRQIVLHLGNGASACAIDGGRSIDTSMGLTPLEGLVMGTRSGDLDPAVVFHLHRRLGASFESLEEMLNRSSGLLGLSGHADMRDVIEAAAGGHAASELAIETYAHRVRGYIGKYLVGLGGLDVLSFTAGTGENSAPIRARIVEGLEFLGLRLDPERNEADARGRRRISADDSAVEILVVPTDEEVEIARQSLAAVSG